MAKQVKEIKTFDERKVELIELGQKKGFITFEELADALKGLDSARYAIFQAPLRVQGKRDSNPLLFPRKP